MPNQCFIVEIDSKQRFLITNPVQTNGIKKQQNLKMPKQYFIVEMCSKKLLRISNKT
jgi:hypothetical protein